MSAASLQDIDELVLSCRNPRTRTLIAEAVACYKSGAYRSCVVAIWVAIMYDVIGKLEELEAAGSRPAGALLEPLRKAKAKPEAEIEAGLVFERTVLDHLVGADLELISHQEHLDLKRIFEDRHRCAHPAMSAGFEPYAMSAEQARTHLRNAITCLLQHPPAQGKFAKDLVVALIQSDLFPNDVDKATEALRHTPLPGGRPILVRAIVLGLTTDLLRQDRPQEERRRQFAALAGTRRLRPHEANAPLVQNLSTYVAGLDDARLHRAVEFVGLMEDTWHLLDHGQQARLIAFVSARAPQLQVEILKPASAVVPLRDAIASRARDLPALLLGQLLCVLEIPGMQEEAVRRFVHADSYQAASSTAKTFLIPSAGRLTADQLSRMLDSFRANQEVYGSFGVATSLAEVLATAAPEALAEIPATVRLGAIEQIDFLAERGWRQPEHAILRAALAALG